MNEAWLCESCCDELWGMVKARVSLGQIMWTHLENTGKPRGLECGNGCMVGPSSEGCPNGWVYVPSGSSVETVREALARSKEGRKAWPQQ